MVPPKAIVKSAKGGRSQNICRGQLIDIDMATE